MPLPEELPLTAHELKKLFKAAGYTSYRQVGKALGVTKTTVCKWMKGKLKLSPKAQERIRDIPVRPGAESTWSDYLAEVPATIAHYRASLPPVSETAAPEADAPELDPKALAEAIAHELAPVLKVDAVELAELLAKRLDEGGLAPGIASRLLPDLRKVVEEAARQFAETLEGREETREAVEKALVTCVERVARLLEQHTADTADAVERRVHPRLNALAAVFKHALDALAAAFKQGLDALGGRMEGEARQNAHERAQDRARRDAQERSLQGLHAKADELRNEVRELRSDSADHRRMTWATNGLVLAGFAAVIVTVVVRTQPAGPGHGGWHTAGGVTEEVARGSRWAAIPFLGRYFSGNTGEKSPPELYVPDHPLPGQKRDHCNPNRAEQIINGGCWVGTDMSPPCRELYRHGNKCYRPVAEDPDKPIGGPSDPPDREEARQGDTGMPGKEP